MEMWRGKGDLIQVNHDQFAHFCCYCPVLVTTCPQWWFYSLLGASQARPRGTSDRDTLVIVAEAATWRSHDGELGEDWVKCCHSGATHILGMLALFLSDLGLQNSFFFGPMPLELGNADGILLCAVCVSSELIWVGTPARVSFFCCAMLET
jgi:hypothetical protein